MARPRPRRSYGLLSRSAPWSHPLRVFADVEAWTSGPTALDAYGARSWVPLSRMTPLAQARTADVFAHRLGRTRSGAAEREVVLELLERCDYRLAAGALRALALDPQRFGQFAVLVDAAAPAAEHASALHRWAVDPSDGPSEVPLRVVHELDDLLAGGADEMVVLPLAEGALEIVDAIRDAGSGDVGRFLEAQMDLAGTNTLVRGGVVRQWVDPRGLPFAAKRSNPLKPGRFERELRTIGMVADRLGEVSDQGAGLELVVPRPIVILKDGPRGALQSITPLLAGGNQLDRLLVAADGAGRAQALATYRAVMERLYAAGVVWDDMSPRNMLIDDDGTIAIVDFEKTTIVDPPVSMARRVAHCRGQAGTEELQLFFSTNEVVDSLHPYLAPDSWSTTDPRPAMGPPRAELADLLRHRQHETITLGELHQLELDVMAVREPFTTAAGARMHPGLINHKIDAYLEVVGEPPGPWDSQVTEVLLEGRASGRYEAAVQACVDLADELEAAAILDEVGRRLARSYLATAPTNPAAASVMAGLEALRAARS